MLLHITSLPGLQHKGDLGDPARDFMHFMRDCGLSVWQILPLGPTHIDGSPYQCLSTHAGNPELISLQWLVRRGWLDEPFPCPLDQAEHARLLEQAAQQFFNSAEPAWHKRYATFVSDQDFWLADYALYLALKQEHQNHDWRQWPQALRERDPVTLADKREQYQRQIDVTCFSQFVFFTQWGELRRDAAELGIRLFGDMPIYVSMDSADVWAQRENFLIDQTGQCEVVAGVPPDAFSDEGQLWGNPLFNWERMHERGYEWWVNRLKTHLKLFDFLRVDHFRALESHWQIPAEAATAAEGQWVETPGRDLLDCLYRNFDSLPIIAEDLGLITDPVRELRDDYCLPGMAVLQFAFDGDPKNEYLPHNHKCNSVAYTGTHDNDTTLGWYQQLDPPTQQRVALYLGRSGESLDMPWLLNRVALASTACLTILPMQDLLSLDSNHRMNVPGTSIGNWSWRFDWEQIWPSLAADLKSLVELYGRGPG